MWFLTLQTSIGKLYVISLITTLCVLTQIWVCTAINQRMSRNAKVTLQNRLFLTSSYWRQEPEADVGPPYVKSEVGSTVLTSLDDMAPLEFTLCRSSEDIELGHSVALGTLDLQSPNEGSFNTKSGSCSDGSWKTHKRKFYSLDLQQYLPGMGNSSSPRRISV